MAIVTATRRQTLGDLPNNAIGSVEAVTATDEQSLRLAGLGLSVGREVRVVKCGEPLIVQVYGTRIGLAKSLAAHVHIAINRSEDG